VGGSSSVAEDLGLERAPSPAPEQDEAEAASLPPAVHLIMVVCCVEDERQPRSLGHAAGGEVRLGGQAGEPSAVQAGPDGPPAESGLRSTLMVSMRCPYLGLWGRLFSKPPCLESVFHWLLFSAAQG